MGKLAFGITIIDGKSKMELQIKEGNIEDLSLLLSNLKVIEKKIIDRVEKLLNVNDGIL